MNLMNACRHVGLKSLLRVAVVFFSVATLQAAVTNQAAVSPNAPAPAMVNTNEYRSVFDSQGRDPFFPNSTRVAAAPAEGAANQPAIVFVLKGFSGTANRRFAIINDRTFSVGEESEVHTAGGRVRIRCLEIRDNMVVMSVVNTGQKMELRLPSRF